MPVGGALEGVAGAAQQGLIELTPHQLQAERQTVGRDAGGHGQGRAAREVEGRGKLHERRGVGVALNSLGVNYLFATRSLALFGIDAGHLAPIFALMGLILGAWR